MDSQAIVVQDQPWTFSEPGCETVGKPVKEARKLLVTLSKLIHHTLLMVMVWQKPEKNIATIVDKLFKPIIDKAQHNVNE